jgi:thiamine pyrophosphate-dependent acetolactate synthase large subunit-like protein
MTKEKKPRVISDIRKPVLSRVTAVPAVIGKPDDFLFVTGVGAESRDVVAMTKDGGHVFTLGGAMGAASMIGLGLALAQPKKRVLVVTGDGELLMSVGCLITIAVLNPPNLGIVCVDNGVYGETGNQVSHTGRGVGLDKIAAAAGIPIVRTVNRSADFAAASKALRQDTGTSFVLLRVTKDEAPMVDRSMDAAFCRTRFRAALLGKA